MKIPVKRILIWIGAVCTAATPLAAILVVSVLYIQAASTFTSSKPPATTSGHTQYLSWEEPFAYKAKVYVSSDYQIQANVTRFFEDAQLVWQTESQNLANRYPQLTKRAHITIPQPILDGNMNSMLFAHIFVQQPDQFSPHPNLNDPYMIHAVSGLAFWNWSAKDPKDVMVIVENDPKDRQLVGYSRLSWAIVLENHAVKPELLPSPFKFGIRRRRWKDKISAVYNPPLFTNSITENRPKPFPLMHSNGSLPKSIEVDLKLAGLSKAKVSVKTALLEISKGRFSSAFKSDNIIDFANSASNDWIFDMQMLSEPQYFVHSFSIYATLAIAMIVHTLTVVCIIAVTTSIGFWTGHTARWSGVSRTTLGMMVANDILQAAQSFRHGSILGSLLGTPILVDIYIVLRMQNVLPMWFKYRFTKESSQQEPTLELMKTIESQPSRRQRVASMRKTVDAAALRWIRLAIVPVVGIASILALVENGYQVFSWDYIEDTGQWVSYALVTVCLVPQIILNFCLRTGSLTPSTDYIFALSALLAEQLVLYISNGEKENLDILMIPHYLCCLAIIFQWIGYYKFKQD